VKVKILPQAPPPHFRERLSLKNQLSTSLFERHQKSEFKNQRSKIDDRLVAGVRISPEISTATGGFGAVTGPVPCSCSLRFTRSMSTTSFFDS
jgi:hypothetical protein